MYKPDHDLSKLIKITKLVECETIQCNCDQKDVRPIDDQHSVADLVAKDILNFYCETQIKDVWGPGCALTCYMSCFELH